MAIEKDKVIQMNAEGFSNVEIAEKLDTTHQQVAKVLKATTKVEVEMVDCVPDGVYTADEYFAANESIGKPKFGGTKGVKVKATTEELRALINTKWTPSMVMEKWQYSEYDLTLLLHALSKKELRDRPVQANFKQDMFK